MKRVQYAETVIDMGSPVSMTGPKANLLPLKFYINSVWLAIEAREHPAMICRRLMVFPLIVSQEFLKLLQEMESRALVILAHYFALSATLADIWWTGHIAHREVLAIEKMVNGQWVISMSWPLTTVASHCRICT
jgi:hypothetical protein